MLATIDHMITIGVDTGMPSVPLGKPQNSLDEAYGPHLYTLDDDDNPQPTFDRAAWARWMNARALEDGQGEGSRPVVYLRLADGLARHELAGGVRVATVFLGMDMAFGRWGNQGEPILWRTTITGGHRDQYTRTAGTLADAIAAHVHALDYASETNGHT